MKGGGGTAFAPRRAARTRAVGYRARQAFLAPAAPALPESPPLTAIARVRAALLGLALGALAIAACAGLGLLFVGAAFGSGA